MNRGRPTSIKFRTRENSHKGKAMKTRKTYRTVVLSDPFKSNGDSFFDIPEELLIEILSKLPLKSLARFKCVSKTFHLLILNAVPMTKVPKLIILSRYDYDRFSFQSLDEKTFIESVCSPKQLEHILDDKTKQMNIVKIHSFCDGLLLIQINNDLFVWDPVTKFFRHVLTNHHLGVENYGNRYFLADLCFDYSTYQYKVLLVEKEMSFTFDVENFFVATCGIDRWESIRVPNTIHNVFPGPLFRGYRHWISKGRNSQTFGYHRFVSQVQHQRIIYFNPSRNKFVEVARSPQHKEGDIDTFLDLGVLRDCLCITRWDDPTNSQGNIELLVMKEYGNGDSWEIMFVFLNTPEFRSYGSMKPLFMTKKGEVWVMMDMSLGPCVKAYDIHGNFLRNIWLPPDECIYKNNYKLFLTEEISPIGYSCVETENL